MIEVRMGGKLKEHELDKRRVNKCKKASSTVKKNNEKVWMKDTDGKGG